MGAIIMKKIYITFLLAFVIVTRVWAGSVTVPNTFVDGTTASADEVNENFDSIETAVNDNDTRINNMRSINVYVNGVRRGAFIESVSDGFINTSAVRLLLDTQYFTILLTSGDGVREVPLSYLTNNCTGQAYLAIQNMNPIVARQGLVVRNDSPSPNSLYYAPAGSLVENLLIESSTTGGTCNDIPTTSSDAVKVIVNDSTITGVSAVGFSGDVTIGF